MKPGKIVCVGWNYRSHLQETDAALPEEPLLFLKPSSCLVYDGQPIRLPPGVGSVHHEVELALIIGKDGRDIKEEDALLHISHLAAFNDVTARDLQTAARSRGEPWSLSKGMDTFGPISHLVPLESVADLENLRLELRVNGEMRQHGNSGQMVFGPRQLIAYISRFMTLEEGDIIATGTPEGVGPLQPGDFVEAWVEGVGRVGNPVI
ncbi:MAG: fumarylacetoacetate hydrolase family protein [Candidatus Methanomethylophilaceae archaeon]